MLVLDASRAAVEIGARDEAREHDAAAYFDGSGAVAR